MAQNRHGTQDDDQRGGPINAKLIPMRNEIVRPETTTENFEKTKSLRAQVYNKREGPAKEIRLQSIRKLEEQERVMKMAVQQEGEDQKQIQLQQQLKNAVNEKDKLQGKIKKRRFFNPTRIFGLSAVCIAYVWQFLFAVFSLIAFASQVGVETFKNETWIGNFFGFFINFEKFFPGEDIGFLFYGLASITAIAVFLVYLVWFQFTGIRPFSTIVSIFTTVLCISLSLLPVTNIFPWTIIWIVYCFSMSLFSNKA